ncbi:MAG: hypothetical protein QNJ55_12875 [Xenococcus sp. MO_188.B8]|nr:hypothetical protein [Xenococcus sp. MO_188.B8]
MLTVNRDQKSQEYRFHDIMTLAEEAEKLGKRAMQLGLISSLTVHVFPDCWQFSLSNNQESELLTPQEAYLHFKKLLETSDR